MNKTQTMMQQIADYFKTQPVLKAWIFGSFARGEERADSDVDILFVPDMSSKFSLFTLGGMYMDLKDLLGREIDLVPEGSLLPFAQETAEKDMKLIYERIFPSTERHVVECHSKRPAAIETTDIAVFG